MPYELVNGNLRIGVDTDDMSVHFYAVLRIQVNDWLNWHCKKLELRGIHEIDFDELLAVASESLGILGYDDVVPDDLKTWIADYFESTE